MIKYFDGGFGSMLNLKAGELPEQLNITNPQRVLDVHNAYANAGADIITANTFGANRLKYPKNCAQIVKAGVSLAKSTGKKVALDLGPTGKLLKPMGDLDFEECVSIYAEVINAGKEQADLVLIETMGDTYEIKAAMLAAKENCDLPIFVSMIFNENARLLTGADVKTACTLVEALGASAIGFNCGLGPEQMLPLVKTLRECTSLPILVMPNAGLPQVSNGKTVYNVSAQDFAKCMTEIAQIGVSYLGGCCGTTPEHIKALVASTSSIPANVPEPKNITAISSYCQTAQFGAKSLVIGERINPTGKKAFKEALRNNDIDYILKEAISQKDVGCHILDVNVGLPEIDECTMLKKAVTSIQAVTSLPLQIDTADTNALEQALRIYNGKPLLNSVNGKALSMKAVFPLAKKYGATVVALCLDEDGIPPTADGRIKIAQKIISTAKSYGIDKKDIVVDALTLTIGTNTDNAIETLNAVDYLRNTMGVHTVLGVSNISFGLPQREVVNTAFYTLALQKGLSAGIINPKSQPMMNAYYAFNALNGVDVSFEEYISNVAQITTSLDSAQITLDTAIIKGMKEESVALTIELLKTQKPLDIISSYIIPALDKVGIGFEKNTVFLPQLLMSADCAKAAFDQIKAVFEQTASNDTNTTSPNKIIIATVEGDIHDIGKNIVKVLLQNYGFDVIDLGKDVKCQDVVDAVKKYGAKLVGLSALMTTTVPNMQKTIELLHSQTDAKVTVGGAVLTQEYANMINADFYTKDAMSCVRLAQQFFSE